MGPADSNTVTEDKEHEMAGQLWRAQSGTLAKITETWRKGCFSQKQQCFLFLFLFFFWRLRGNSESEE